MKMAILISIGILCAVGLGLFAQSLIDSNMADKPFSEELQVNLRSNTEYWPESPGEIIAEVRNSTYGAISGATCLFTIISPDGTPYAINKSATGTTSLGTYHYDFDVPKIEGVYEYSVVCTKNGKTYVSGKSFHVQNYMADLVFQGPDIVKKGEIVQMGWREQSGGWNITEFNCTIDGIKYISPDTESFMLTFDTKNMTLKRDNVLSCNVTINADYYKNGITRSIGVYPNYYCVSWNSNCGDTIINPNYKPNNWTQDGAIIINNTYFNDTFTRPNNTTIGGRWIESHSAQYSNSTGGTEYRTEFMIDNNRLLMKQVSGGDGGLLLNGTYGAITQNIDANIYIVSLQYNYFSADVNVSNVIGSAVTFNLGASVMFDSGNIKCMNGTSWPTRVVVGNYTMGKQFKLEMWPPFNDNVPSRGAVVFVDGRYISDCYEFTWNGNLTITGGSSGAGVQYTYIDNIYLGNVTLDWYTHRNMSTGLDVELNHRFKLDKSLGAWVQK